MSDALDEWYRAELAATMRPCPQYNRHQPEPAKPKPLPRSRCPICRTEYTRSYLGEHIERRHSQELGNGAETVDGGAA
jgi:hypothetical protein